ncbi:class I tRNA ligase family protein, partial [Candidatus Woesearchaeota archaeon]|nr:class I tRNA ligase family protein [Candidatus Woesearchaeota archaeon]
MVNFNKIAKKWQIRWEKDKVFQAEVDNRKKYFIAIVYPYMSGLLHLGHLFTYTSSEVLARYKRMNNFNVLVKFAFHCTGTPIVAAAQRIKEKEPKQIETLKMMGITGKQLVDFEVPEHWCNYFSKETKKDLKNMGFAVDERYMFKTTSLNPPYDSFIRWQFNTLKKKGYVKKGKHPVVWCTKCSAPVGDHARAEGEGITHKDFIWGKFRMRDSDLILLAGTTRPDAFYGQTHLWIDPDGHYKVVQVGDEKWVVGAEAVEKITMQYMEAEIIKDIDPKEIIGKWVKGPLVNHEVYTVPAWFIDSKVGSGIVFSALEDPVDLIEVQHIQSNMEMIHDFNLDLDVIKKLKPISIINVPGMGGNLGQDMIDKYKINSPKDKKSIKDAKDELNRE